MLRLHIISHVAVCGHVTWHRLFVRECVCPRVRTWTRVCVLGHECVCAYVRACD